MICLPKIPFSLDWCHIHTKDDFARRILDRAADDYGCLQFRCIAGSDFWAVKSSLGQFVAGDGGLDIHTIHNRNTSRSVAECASKILRQGHGELTVGLG